MNFYPVPHTDTDLYDEEMLCTVSLDREEVLLLTEHHHEAARRATIIRRTAAKEYHAARGAVFQQALLRLEPKQEVDGHEVSGVADRSRSSADIRSGELLGGNVVQMRHPLDEDVPLQSDWEFFEANPRRRFRVRQTTIKDLDHSHDPHRAPEPDQITIVEKVGPHALSVFGFDLQIRTPLVQGDVENTDEDIQRLLFQMNFKVDRLPEITPFSPEFVGDEAMVSLSRDEMKLLADAIEANATRHDNTPGSCPRDLYDSNARANDLRNLADRPT